MSSPVTNARAYFRKLGMCGGFKLVPRAPKGPLVLFCKHVDRQQWMLEHATSAACRATMSTASIQMDGGVWSKSVVGSLAALSTEIRVVHDISIESLMSLVILREDLRRTSATMTSVGINDHWLAAAKTALQDRFEQITIPIDPKSLALVRRNAAIVRRTFDKHCAELLLSGFEIHTEAFMWEQLHLIMKRRILWRKGELSHARAKIWIPPSLALSLCDTLPCAAVHR